MNTETIAAIATAMSPAGISIIRISGPESVNVIDRIFYPAGKKKISQVKSHTIHYGTIMDEEQAIDQVLVLVMREPHSYTGEDTVEIDCHGGILVTKRILETVLKNGARVAEPGEFTKRAFLNGKIDLSQAEAVSDLIQAKNQFALSSSVHQLQGSVAKEVHRYREEILDSMAFIEAALDDPEHLSADGYGEELKGKIYPMLDSIDRLLHRAENGKIISEGIKTVLLGKPNAGKSSILNMLSGTERSIVTEIAGTTRDTIEEQIRIGSFSFQMMDTAGIRDTADQVEQIGVDRAKKAAEEADLVLFVCDSSIPLDEDDEKILSILEGKKAVCLLNKSDLCSVVEEKDIRKKGFQGPFVELSAKIGSGRDQLENILTRMYEIGDITANDQVFLTNERQKQAFRQAKESLNMVIESIDQGMTEDFYTVDLMNAYTQLGEVVGESVEEDLINRIFSKFCMGK